MLNSGTCDGSGLNRGIDTLLYTGSQPFEEISNSKAPKILKLLS